MNVGAILKQKGRAVETARLETSLVDISRAMIEKGVGSVVILDDEGSIAGLISERDIVRVVAQAGETALAKPVASCQPFLERAVPQCSEQDSLSVLMNEMTQMRARHIPVVDAGQVVGLISIGDVVKARIAETEMEAQAMRSYIATG